MYPVGPPTSCQRGPRGRLVVCEQAGALTPHGGEKGNRTPEGSFRARPVSHRGGPNSYPDVRTISGGGGLWSGGALMGPHRAPRGPLSSQVSQGGRVRGPSLPLGFDPYTVARGRGHLLPSSRAAPGPPWHDSLAARRLSLSLRARHQKEVEGPCTPLPYGRAEALIFFREPPVPTQLTRDPRRSPRWWEHPTTFGRERADQSRFSEAGSSSVR